MDTENIWALRGVAARMGQVGHLAVVALCDSLLQTRKERDAAEQALQAIKNARARPDAAAVVLDQVRKAAGSFKGDLVGYVASLRRKEEDAELGDRNEESATRVLSKVREAAGMGPLGSVIEFVGDLRHALYCSAKAHDLIREAAGVPMGEDVAEFITGIRKERDEAQKEAEGLYRFKLRIREALGVEKGVDMAAEVKHLVETVNREGRDCILVHRPNWESRTKIINEQAAAMKRWEHDFREVSRRVFRQDAIIGDIGRIVGSKDLTADGVLAHVKSLPQTVDHLRLMASASIGFVPLFLHAGQCERFTDTALRQNLETVIRNVIARANGRQNSSDQHVRDALYKVCEDVGIKWPGECRSSVEDIIRDMVGAIKGGKCSAYNDPAMRQNLAEKTAALELAGTRIKELESTIREHEKDLAVIEELTEEQGKLVAQLIRMAEGKADRDPRTASVNPRGIPFILDPNVPINTMDTWSAGA